MPSTCRQKVRSSLGRTPDQESAVRCVRLARLAIGSSRKLKLLLGVGSEPAKFIKLCLTASASGLGHPAQRPAVRENRRLARAETIERNFSRSGVEDLCAPSPLRIFVRYCCRHTNRARVRVEWYHSRRLTASSVVAMMPACMLMVPNPGSRNRWPVHCDRGIHLVWPFKLGAELGLVIVSVSAIADAHIPRNQNRAAKQHH